MTPLAELLPHAAPMILLSDYEEPTAEDSVLAFVDVGKASPFYEQSLGGVPACVALEYMAQTMALLVGLSRRRKGLKPQLGFVLGSRKLETRLPFFCDGERYRISATCTYEDESFGSFDCVIADRDGKEVARGTLTAFQPEGEVTPEKIEEFS